MTLWHCIKFFSYIKPNPQNNSEFGWCYPILDQRIWEPEEVWGKVQSYTATKGESQDSNLGQPDAKTKALPITLLNFTCLVSRDMAYLNIYMVGYTMNYVSLELQP